MRSTMAQSRLQGLALLCIELDLTKTIDSVASKKDRKAPQYKHVVNGSKYQTQLVLC